jgi:glyoxylase-like metal-dependent hydrolase (beta-lactamase superfamily II)
MRICIHRGTKEIGGTCVEIESQGQRLVLDVGLPLVASNADDFELHPIKGFDAPDPSLLGVLITHPHQDHYGLAYRLPPETPFLIGKAACSLAHPVFFGVNARAGSPASDGPRLRCQARNLGCCYFRAAPLPGRQDYNLAQCSWTTHESKERTMLHMTKIKP